MCSRRYQLHKRCKIRAYLAQGLEARVVPAHKIKLYQIAVKGLRGKGLLRKVLAPVQLLFAICQCLWLMLKLRPKLVVGFGGYVAGPGGVAAWIARRTLMIHEQNTRAGLTNRLLARLSKQIYTGFPGVLESKKTQYVGNPLRADFKAMSYRAHKPMHLLVVGGSLGAQVLNTTVPEALALLPTGMTLQVRHQAGKSTLAIARSAYDKVDVSAEVTPFIDDMAKAFQWADVIIARAGALTVSEIAACGRPAIFIPLPHAVDDHQYHNAMYLAAAGGALCCRQAKLTPQWLTTTLEKWLVDDALLKSMAAVSRAMAKIDAADVMVRKIMQSIGKEK